MLNTHLLAPFSKAYRQIEAVDHHITDEILLTRPTL